MIEYLEVGGSVELPAVPRFVARDKFITEHFGGDNKAVESPPILLADSAESLLEVVETAVPAASLKHKKMLKSDRGWIPILEAFFGTEDCPSDEEPPVALAHVFYFLKTAERNLKFIFFVVDAKGTVRLIIASWCFLGGGWALDEIDGKLDDYEGYHLMSY